MQEALKAEGAQSEVVSPHLGLLGGSNGADVAATRTLANCSSVLFDAVYVPGGEQSVQTLLQQGDARRFIDEAYKHGKAIAAAGEGVDLVMAAEIGEMLKNDSAFAATFASQGVILDKDNSKKDVVQQFINAVAQHRFRNRSQAQKIAV
jgi:catalase